MIISFSEYTFDIDVERTRAFYNRADVLPMGEDCGCIGCRNFDKAMVYIKEAIKLDAVLGKKAGTNLALKFNKPQMAMAVWEGKDLH